VPRRYGYANLSRRGEETDIAVSARTCHDRGVEAILWIVLGVALAIAEAFTAALFIIFFALGALAAGGVAALGGDPLLQVIVFALVSGISVTALRPIIMHHARHMRENSDNPFGMDVIGGGPDAKIGMEAIEGGHGFVLEEVDGDRGMIKIDGEMWQARSFDGNEKYLPGERVRVVKVIGATAIVWREDLPQI
jgi:membrane protein implicated in regulation of membrane protease activity